MTKGQLRLRKMAEGAGAVFTALTRLAFVLKQLVESTAAQYVLYVDEVIAWRRTNSENACDRRN